MGIRNIFYCFIICGFFLKVSAQNTPPVVSNVSFTITNDTVDIYYDVNDAEQSMVTIKMEVSNDGGSTYNFSCIQISDDIGNSITIGTVKHIIWAYGTEHPGVFDINFRIKIIADDLVGDQIYYSGKIYNTVKIGNQVWLKENLDVGTIIQGIQNESNNGTIEKYCYGDDTANCTKFGGLYQWAESVQYQNGATDSTSPNPDFSGNVQGICPAGWHIPANDEFTTLKTTVLGESNSLKSVGQGIDSAAGTNTSGFSALLSGVRVFDNGTFTDLGIGGNGYFWSCTESEAIRAGLMDLYGRDSTIRQYNANKKHGFSIRCIKN